MLDLDYILDYLQSDCVVDIYDCTSGKTIAQDLSEQEAREWHDSHDYDFCSFEPIQRIDDHGETIFGIVFNVENVEER